MIEFLAGVCVGLGMALVATLARLRHTRTACPHDRIFTRKVTPYLGGSADLFAVCQCGKNLTFPLGQVVATDAALIRAAHQVLVARGYSLATTQEEAAVYERIPST